MMIFYIFVYIYAKTYCKFIYSFTPKLYVKIMSDIIILTLGPV